MRFGAFLVGDTPAFPVLFELLVALFFAGNLAPLLVLLYVGGRRAARFESGCNQNCLFLSLCLFELAARGDGDCIGEGMSSRHVSEVAMDVALSVFPQTCRAFGPKSAAVPPDRNGSCPETDLLRSLLLVAVYVSPPLLQ